MKRIAVLLVVVVLLIVIVFPANAEVSQKWEPTFKTFNWKQTDWEDEDTSLQTAVIIFMAADWAQTRYIASNTDEYLETNSILGPHPDLDEVDRYFAFCMLGNTAIAYFLPKNLRKWWQVLSLSMQVGYVNQNFDLGIKMKF